MDEASRQRTVGVPFFHFRSPCREEMASIRFLDDAGSYSLGDLLDGVWIHLTNPVPIPDWLQWYRLLYRLVSYGKLDAPRGMCQVASGWPTCPHEAGLIAHTFRDESGETTLLDLIRVIRALAPTNPTLAERLIRTIIHIATLDHHRDLTARAILAQAGLLGDD